MDRCFKRIIITLGLCQTEGIGFPDMWLLFLYMLHSLHQYTCMMDRQTLHRCNIRLNQYTFSSVLWSAVTQHRLSSFHDSVNYAWNSASQCFLKVMHVHLHSQLVATYQLTLHSKKLFQIQKQNMTTFWCQNTFSNGSCECGFTMINMTNCANIEMWLVSNISLLSCCRSSPS